MSRHRAARGSHWWALHALAGGASAAGIALVIAFGDWSGQGALVQPFHEATSSASSTTARPCVATSSTTAEGRTWHGCWPTYATSPTLPSSQRTPRPAPSSTTTAVTPPEAVLPPADPFAEED